MKLFRCALRMAGEVGNTETHLEFYPQGLDGPWVAQLPLTFLSIQVELASRRTMLIGCSLRGWIAFICMQLPGFITDLMAEWPGRCRWI